MNKASVYIFIFKLVLGFKKQETADKGDAKRIRH